MKLHLIELVALLPYVVVVGCGGATAPAEDPEGGSPGTGGVTSQGGASNGGASNGGAVGKGGGATALGGAVGNGGSVGKGGSPAGGAIGIGSAPAGGTWIGIGGAVGGSGGGTVTGGCIYNGTAYSWGQTFPATDGCNSCMCDMYGVACTAMACPAACIYNGMLLTIGETVLAEDGCNSCTCTASATGSAAMACTKMACISCTYAGRTYSNGASFLATDGCNKCSCSNGSVVCTDMACSCNPSQEHWRSYVTTNAAQCAVINYRCAPNTTPFSNACGCGCEQSPECPQYFQCVYTTSAGAAPTLDIAPIGTGGQSGVAMPVPACATAAQVAQCPLTEVLLL